MYVQGETTFGGEVCLVNFTIVTCNVCHFIPCSGFVRGNTGDVPSLISFQPSFEHGALLTIVSVFNLFNFGCDIRFYWRWCMKFRETNSLPMLSVSL